MNSSNCNCLKLLDTYAIIEKNLIKDIDILQCENKQLIDIYKNKVDELEQKLVNLKIFQNNKIQLLSKELIIEKITNHELKNELKLLEDNLRCDTLKKKSRNLQYKYQMQRFVNNLDELVTSLSSKISLLLVNKDKEIGKLFKAINSQINEIRFNQD